MSRKLKLLIQLCTENAITLYFILPIASSIERSHRQMPSPVNLPNLYTVVNN
ncbi:hypothetical protein [Nostoc commune]|uniref:hypothetical protein n=1 Tax=Nostoc commune TaxID=1178 RepID=UPI0015E81FF6|nr:hypothetical protein [Nostoc commune]